MSFTGHGWRSGQLSDVNTGTAATPTVVSLNPAGPLARSNTAITLIVTGTGFASGDTIYVNYSPLTTTFTDSTHVQTTAFIPRRDDGAAGTIPVGVRRTGQALSNTVNISVT